MSTEIYKKYIEGKSYRELHEIRHQSIPGTDVYEQVVEEIHRIQQNTNYIQIANLITEIQKLKDITSENSVSSKQFARWSLIISVSSILIALFIGVVQIYLAKIQVAPIVEQQDQLEKQLYENCKEPGNWDIIDGGATPRSKCKDTYLNLKERWGTHLPAENSLK